MKQKWKGGAMLSPLPAVLVSCGDEENANILTIAWTGILSTTPPRVYISVRPTRHSFDIIEKTGEFCINLPCSYNVRQLDFCGVKSGKDTDKFREAHFTKEQSFEVNCPSVAECPVTLECKVFDKRDFGTHTAFFADVVAVSVDEKLIDENGRLALEKAGLLAYAHGQYFALGKKIGEFGFSVKKKKKGKK